MFPAVAVVVQIGEPLQGAQGRGKREPVAHLVFSDGLVAVSVFIEPIPSMPGQSTGAVRQGGLNVYSLRLDEHFVTALGEAPAVTVRQIAQSVARR